MQEAWVWSLVWEDPTWREAYKPACHNCWVCALNPGSRNYWKSSTLEFALQQEKPPLWEACAPSLESSPLAPAREKQEQQWRPKAAKRNAINFKEKRQEKREDQRRHCHLRGCSFPESWDQHSTLRVGTVGSLGTWNQRRNKPASLPNNPVIQRFSLSFFFLFLVSLRTLSRWLFPQPFSQLFPPFFRGRRSQINHNFTGLFSTVFRWLLFLQT